MPRFDGTGPRGEGPFTGRGEGYCVMRLPRPGTEQAGAGYAGIQGRPVHSQSIPTSRPLARSPTLGLYLRAWPRGRWRPAWRMGRGRRRR